MINLEAFNCPRTETMVQLNYCKFCQRYPRIKEELCWVRITVMKEIDEAVLRVGKNIRSQELLERLGEEDPGFKGPRRGKVTVAIENLLKKPGVVDLLAREKIAREEWKEQQVMEDDKKEKRTFLSGSRIGQQVRALVNEYGKKARGGGRFSVSAYSFHLATVMPESRGVRRYTKAGGWF